MNIVGLRWMLFWVLVSLGLWIGALYALGEIIEYVRG